MATNAKSLKIGLVFDDSLDKPDGVTQYVLAIGGWLSSQGHEVHYLVGQTARTDIPNIHSLSRNIAVRFNRNRLSIPLPTSRRKLKTFLMKEQFDVLHVQVPYSPWLAHRLIMAAGPKTAIVGTFHIVAHSKVVHFGTQLLALWTKRSTKRFDTIYSVSPAAVDYAKQTYGITTTVLPNVVDYPRFHAAKPFTKYRDGTMNILFLGRLVPRKGCLLLLQAINELTARELPAIRVLVCGKGPLEATLKSYVADHQLETVVEFVGFVTEEDKPRYYASADIAVFPSTGGESFGIVLIEAMASGKTAVLAGDNSGYSSVMAPRPDLIFDAHNAKQLTDKLELLVTNQAARSAAQQWGEKYTKQFDIAIVGQQLMLSYQEILKRTVVAK